MITVKKGDFGFFIPAVIRNYDWKEFSLATYTCTLKVWAKDTPSVLKWSIEGTVTDEAKGEVRFDVKNTHFTEVGNFVGEIELTRAGHVESTESFAVIVKESG